MADIISSIGTNGRDYSTISSWIDATPSDLVGQGDRWIGECYNDSEFSERVSIGGGINADASNNQILRVAAGESLFDNTANPLSYDQTLGVGNFFSWTSSDYNAALIVENYAVVREVQFKWLRTGTYEARAGLIYTDGYFGDTLLEFDIRSSGGGTYVLTTGSYYGQRGGQIFNVLLINVRDDPVDNAIPIITSSGGQFVNTGIVVPDGLANPYSGTAFTPGGAYAGDVINCYAFVPPGATGFGSGWSGNSDGNASSDATAPGTSVVHNAVAADNFVNSANNFQLVENAPIGAFAPREPRVTFDIFGTDRTDPTSAGPHVFAGGAPPGDITGTAAFQSDIADWNASGDVTAPIPPVTGEANFDSLSADWAAEGINTQQISGTAQFLADSAEWLASGDVSPPPSEGDAAFQSDDATWHAEGVVGDTEVGQATFQSEPAEWNAVGEMQIPPATGEGTFVSEQVVWEALGLWTPPEPPLEGTGSFESQPVEWNAEGTVVQPPVSGEAHFVSQPATWRASDRIFPTGEQINDCILSIVSQWADTLNDGMLGYFRFYGATADDINDAAYQFLQIYGVPPADINDMWDYFFDLQGLENYGSLAEKAYQFWCRNGGIPR